MSWRGGLLRLDYKDTHCHEQDSEEIVMNVSGRLSVCLFQGGRTKETTKGPIILILS